MPISERAVEPATETGSHPAGQAGARSTGTLDALDEQLLGLDALDLPGFKRASRWRKTWGAAWPKLAAVVLGLAIWQLIASSGWKPSYLFPGPGTVFSHVWDDRHSLGSGVLTTLRRAAEFYALALLIGTVIAIVATRARAVRAATVPLATGLQSMPSVAWVPIAILLFGVRSQAILFVTLAGSIPAVVLGTVSALDSVPQILVRAGDALGAKGIALYRHVLLPAALPGYLSGARQAWAFAWRSLMAGELIVSAKGTTSLGQLLSAYQDQSLAADVLAVMLAILAVGLLMDGLVFSRLEQIALRRRGLLTD
jgi:NitT/TauT family transport system permease protein